MTKEMTCWKCGGQLSVDSQFAGMQVKCPHCSSVVTVPRELFEAAPAAPLATPVSPVRAITSAKPGFPLLTAAIVFSAINLLTGLIATVAEDPAVLLVAVTIGLGSVCTWLGFHQQLWSLVPEDRRGMSAAKAAWFMLIPFYNLYWVFKSCIPLQNFLNQVLDERQISQTRASVGLAYAFSILMVVSFGLGILCIPVGPPAQATVHILFGGAEFVVWLLMVLNQKQVAIHILQPPATTPSVVPQLVTA